MAPHLTVLLAASLAASAASGRHSHAHSPRMTQRHRSRLSEAYMNGAREEGLYRSDMTLGATAILTPFPAAVADGGNLNISITVNGFPVWPDDFVSISCGNVTSPLDWLDAITLTDAATQPPVSVLFTSLPYLRCDWTAIYWSTVYSPVLAYVPIGNVTIPAAEPFTTPKQIHLGYINDPTSMTVSWTSGGPLHAPPVVQWGLHGAPLSSSAAATTGTYAASDMCGAPATSVAQVNYRDPGLLHNATMTGLAASTAYDYRVGTPTDGWSQVFTFTSAPAPGTPVAFMAYGDQSTDQAAVNSTALVSAGVAAGEASLVLVNGDLGYALGSGYVWDQYMTILQPAAAVTPHLIQNGNHEVDWIPDTFSPIWWNNGFTASNGECGVPMLARFRTPAAAATPFWYSFTWGDVFVAAISSEHDWTENSQQWLWLNATLAAVDRSVTPWVVVSMHRPIYSTQECETGDYVVALHLRTALDSLLWTHRVNLALVAHTHSYERTCPVSSIPGANCTTPGPTCGCAPAGTGVVHMTIGAAGAGLEGCGYSTAFGAFSQAHVNAWGVLKLDTTSTPGFLRTRFILDADGTVYDEAVIGPWSETAAARVERQ